MRKRELFFHGIREKTIVTPASENFVETKTLIVSIPISQKADLANHGGPASKAPRCQKLLFSGLKRAHLVRKLSELTF